MLFWKRGSRKVRAETWIRAEAHSLMREAQLLRARADQQNGVGYPTSDAALAVAAPIYQAIARLAGKTEALKGLAFHRRMQGSLDGYLFQDIAKLNDFVGAFYRDYQQSLGLLLFYPNLNGRLLPPGFTDEQYRQAKEIGSEARGKFIQFWKSASSEYGDGLGSPAEAYATLMQRYTADTGRPATRADFDKPPQDLVPPLTVTLEFRDGSLRHMEGD